MSNNITKIGIHIQAVWKGQGATDASGALGNLEKVARDTARAGTQMGDAVQGGLSDVAKGSQRTAVRMAVLEAKARETAVTLRKLGQDVASGAKSFDEAEAEYAEAEKALEAYREELGLVAEEVKQTETAVEQSNQSSNEAKLAWMELSAKINLAQQAYQAIAAVANRAYQQIKEGARLEAVRNTFASLADSIDETADSLQNQLRVAVNDTVSDIALMEAASRFVSMGLAENGKEAAELAKIASQLGLAFRGDAVAGMEEFALLLANQSIPRLDTFGISASRVREGIEELISTVPGMTRETAFMQATMEQARITMQKVGDQTEGTAGDIARLESAVANISSGLKNEFVQAAAPAVGWLADIAQGFVNTKRAADEAKSSVEKIIEIEREAKTLNDYRQALLDVEEAIERVGAAGSPLSPLATVDARQALLELLADYGRTAQGSDYLRLKMEQMGATVSSTGVSVNGMGISWIELEKTMTRLNNEEHLRKINEEMGKVDAVMLSYQYSVRGAEEGTRKLGAAIRSTTSYTENSTWSTYEWNSAVQQQQAQAWVAAQAMKRKAEELAEAARIEAEALATQREQMILTRQEQERLAAVTGDYFTTAVNAGSNALVTWQRTVITSGGLTREQTANLGELSSAYERTQANIRSLQGGVGSLGLTEEELNKKLAEQYATLGLLEQAMGPLQAITREVVGVNQGYAYNQSAINQALYEAADAAGASATELALLGLATGKLSEEQAVAALKSAALQEKIKELGQAIAEGMDPQVALNHLESFQNRLDATDFTVRLGIEVEDGEQEKAVAKVKDIAAKGVPQDDRKIPLVIEADDTAVTSVFNTIATQTAALFDTQYLIDIDTSVVDTAIETVDVLQTDISELTAPTWVMEVEAAAEQAKGEIAQIESRLAALVGQTYTVQVNVATNDIPGVGSSPPGTSPPGAPPGGSGPQGAYGGGDYIVINTQDRSDLAVQNIQQWQRQKELASRSFS